MTAILLYIGIALIVIGWLALSWFAAKQMRAQKACENMPQKWEEVRHSFIYKRWICRGVIILGLAVLLVFLLLSR